MITLKYVLRANSFSCIGFGLLFALTPSTVANFLSSNTLAPNLVIFTLGLVLICNGLHLIWASFQLIPSKLLIIYFSVGDFLWAIATIFLIIFGLWITTTVGIISSLLVASFVGLFGVLQMVKRKNIYV